MGFARVQFEKPMQEQSAGQQKKILLARSLCERAHLYVWDEPLNYIDLYARMQIEALLRDFAPNEQGTLYILTGVAGNVRYPNLWHENPLDEYVPPQPETRPHMKGSTCR